MSYDLNQCNFICRCGHDPEIKSTNDGKTIAKFSGAVGDKDSTTWCRFVAFGKTADVVAQYVTKGKQLFVSARFRINEWEKDGQKRQSPEFIVDRLQLLGSKSDGPRQDGYSQDEHNEAKSNGYQKQDDRGGIPF